jgi:hypothetical protein
MDSIDTPNKTKSQIESLSTNASNKMDTLVNKLKQSIRNGSLVLNISGHVFNPVIDSLTVASTSFRCNNGQIFLNKKCSKYVLFLHGEKSIFSLSGSIEQFNCSPS